MKPEKKTPTADTRVAGRVLYAVVALTLVVMAVVVGATAAANRARRGTVSTVVTRAPEAGTRKAPAVTSRPVPQRTEPVTESPATAPAPETEKQAPTVAPVADTLPTFLSPVRGTAGKAYSGSALVWSDTMNDYRVHGGLDLSAPVGEAVTAPADGVVREIWKDPMMGWCISLAHSGGAVLTIKNVAADFPEGIVPGREVKTGELIAAVGDGALAELAEAPHVHVELEIDGTRVDPAGYFAASSLAPAGEDYEDR